MPTVKVNYVATAINNYAQLDERDVKAKDLNAVAGRLLPVGDPAAALRSKRLVMVYTYNGTTHVRRIDDVEIIDQGEVAFVNSRIPAGLSVSEKGVTSDNIVINELSRERDELVGKVRGLSDENALLKEQVEHMGRSMHEIEVSRAALADQVEALTVELRAVKEVPAQPSKEAVAVLEEVAPPKGSAAESPPSTTKKRG